ncbi:AAA family ATPase [Aggregatibacter sp.]
MSTITISIKFKDNNNEISFDLTKNNVFYGNNGKGKTRVLKTIELLYGLAKSLDYDSLISQLNELNLSDLKINRKKYSQLFSKYEDSVGNDRRRFEQFILENNHIISNICHKLSVFSSSNIYGDFRYNRRYIAPITNRLNDIVLSNSSSIDELQELMNRIREFLMIERVSEVEDKYIYFNDKFSRNELMDLTKYLSQRISETRFNIKKDDLEIREELQKEKEKVLNALGKKGARYLTIDLNIEAEKIFNKISNSFSSINNAYIKSIWGEEGEVFDGKSKLIDYKNKFKRLQEIISIYNKSLTVNYTYSGDILFYKNSSIIDFIKLSSGEKRLMIIFLNLIFSEEDIILIDEPEMSLSLDYQNKIIGHIMDITSQENKKVMIATHAPYIYEDFISYKENNRVKVY